MDDRRLTELFCDAASDTPPATFSHDQVVTTSRRETARFRARVAGGALFGVVLLAGGGLAVSGLGDGTSGGDPVSAMTAPAPGDREAETLDDPLMAPAEPNSGRDNSGTEEGVCTTPLTSAVVVAVNRRETPTGDGLATCTDVGSTVTVPVTGGAVRASVLTTDVQPTAGVPTARAELSDGRELVVTVIADDPAAPPAIAEDIDALTAEVAAAL